jgi:hypothetical protein
MSEDEQRFWDTTFQAGWVGETHKPEPSARKAADAADEALKARRNAAKAHASM